MSVRRISPRARTVLAALALALSACGGAGVKPEELPTDPIAIGYRDAEDARKRAELLTKPEERGPGKAGVARVNDLSRLFGTNDSREALLQQTLRLSFVDPQTVAVTPLAAAPRGAEPYSWSARRNALSFTLNTDGNPQIYVYEPKSGEVRRVTHGNQPCAHGALGPGERIAYTRADVGPGQTSLRIWVSGPHYSNARPLSPGPADRLPAWSPDGRTVVYVSRGSDGVEVIQAIDPDGDPTPRTLARGRDPVFTPDGGWIVYAARTGSGYRLWKMLPDGSGRLPLGTASEEVSDEVRPAVSPDGHFVAYVGEKEHRQTLRIRRMDGYGDRVLLEDGDGASPAW
jgi:Tol biopolymer transport system component